MQVALGLLADWLASATLGVYGNTYMTAKKKSSLVGNALYIAHR